MKHIKQDLERNIIIPPWSDWCQTSDSQDDDEDVFVEQEELLIPFSRTGATAAKQDMSRG